MSRYTISILFLTFLLVATVTAQAENLFTVSRISDGDTVTCEGYGIKFKIRIAE